jgi:hypothetical protein
MWASPDTARLDYLACKTFNALSLRGQLLRIA